MATYQIITNTGTADSAGTDADVYITLFGSMGNSGERELDTSGNNFEIGQVDTFRLEMQDIGEIIKVRIRHDNSGKKPGWFLDKITVHKEDTDEEWTFPCSRWLSVVDDDCQIDRLLDRS